MTLTDFLLARITEDEAWVTEHVASHGCEVYDAFATSAADCGEMTVGFKRWSAECVAKRRIVEQAVKWERMHQEAGTYMRADDLNLLIYQAKRSLSDDMLRFLALPYGDHPDYREEWKP